MRITNVFILLLWIASVSDSQHRWPIDQYSHQITLYESRVVKASTKETPTINRDTVGPIHLNQTLAEFERRCKHVIYGWNGGDEGIFVPVGFIKFGQGTFLVEFSDTLMSSTITRISSRSSCVKTIEGVGPGSPFKDLTKAFGKPHFGSAECVLFVWFDMKPNLSFRLNLNRQVDCGDLEKFNEEKPPDPPPGTKVDEIIVVSHKY